MTMLTKKMAICVAALFFAVLGAACHANYITVVDSPFKDPFGGDFLRRGFYVVDYGADNLSQVILQYKATQAAGIYDTSLTVRIGSYDGTIVGNTQYLSTYIETDLPQQVVYDFGGVNVPHGSLLTFTQALVDGPDSALYYNTGASSHPQITQTNGTNPPLDSFRRDRVGVTITAIPEPATLSLLTLGALALFLRTRPT